MAVNIIMGRKKAVKTPQPKVITLADALKAIANLPNPATTQKIWRNAITTLAYYSARTDNTDVDMSYDELAKKYKNVDVEQIIKNYEKLVELIESNDIINKTTKKHVGLESKRQYFYAILALVGTNGVIALNKETLEKYKKKKVEYDKMSTEGRKTNEPKRAVLEYPDMTYPVFVKGFDKFVDTHAFTNTAKGRKDLRIACVVGLYILQRPRRIEDYTTLQLYTQLPSETAMKDKNILLYEKVKGDDGKMKPKMTFYIDNFKIRYRTVIGKTKEVLPRFVKEVSPRLTSLLVDYITRWNVVDMSKAKKGEEHYIFYMESGTSQEPYNTNGFSKYVSSCLKQVYKKPRLSVNTIRHVFADWIWSNNSQYNQLQLEKIALEVGDKHMLTQFGYRQANQDNRDLELTQIDDARKNIENVVGNMFEQGILEETGSEMNDEVNSPPMREPPIENASLEQLYIQLGKATMEVERIKWLITQQTQN